MAKQLEVRDDLMAFKCVKGFAPLSLCNKFTTRSQMHTKSTRNNDKLNIPFFLDRQQVSGLSHIGLLSSGMTFQEVYQTWSHLIFLRTPLKDVFFALDEFLSIDFQ